MCSQSLDQNGLEVSHETHHGRSQPAPHHQPPRPSRGGSVARHRWEPRPAKKPWDFRPRCPEFDELGCSPRIVAPCAEAKRLPNKGVRRQPITKLIGFSDWLPIRLALGSAFKPNSTNATHPYHLPQPASAGWCVCVWLN